jgi:hypothetical protein
MRVMLRAGIAALVAAFLMAGAAIAMGAGASEPESVGLSRADWIAFDPIDPSAAVEAGWAATVAEIEERAIAWYRDERVAEATDAELEKAIAGLTNEIGDPPTDRREPDETMYVREMVYRREIVCRSLSPENNLRHQYCSETSLPELGAQAVPWAE